jgi:hypothetical protein
MVHRQPLGIKARDNAAGDQVIVFAEQYVHGGLGKKKPLKQNTINPRLMIPCPPILVRDSAAPKTALTLWH